MQQRGRKGAGKAPGKRGAARPASSAPDWCRPLAQPVPVSGGSVLRTLLDAAEYMAALPLYVATRKQWQVAARLLMAAAQMRTELGIELATADATLQIELALFLEGRLDLGQPPREPYPEERKPRRRR